MCQKYEMKIILLCLLLMVMFTILLVRDSQLQGYIRQEDEELKMLVEKFHDEVQESKNRLGDQIKENRDEIKESKDHFGDQIKANRDEIKESKDHFGVQIKENRDEIKESKDHLSNQINANRDQFEHELKELKTSINKCNSNTNPCHRLHSQSCTDLDEGYECQCKPGFNGKNCELNIDDCKDNTCINGHCQDATNGYQCFCDSGYVGKNCDIKIQTCPVNNPHYRMVEHRCIYFDKTPSTYAEARIRCKGTFNHTGRMYEPKTMEESINVYLVALGSFNFNDWWIGVNDIKEEGKFVFDNNGSPIPFNALWSKGHGSKGKNKNCVLMFIAKWVDWNCSDDWQVGTLCEQL